MFKRLQIQRGVDHLMVLRPGGVETKLFRISLVLLLLLLSSCKATAVSVTALAGTLGLKGWMPSIFVHLLNILSGAKTICNIYRSNILVSKATGSCF